MSEGNTTTVPASGVRGARKAVLAGTIGNVVEWYDFAIYAYSVSVIAALFFPAGNETAALLSTLAIFGVTFLARPLGGVIFGHVGDRVGRRSALAASVLLMGGATVLIGLLPTYGQVGHLAPVLLLVCRLAQGFSLGGEFTGATSFITEYAPENRRGFWASLSPSASLLAYIGGALVVLAVASSLPESAYNSWGWRIPFWVAGPLAAAGLYLRLRIEETPAFRALESDEGVDRAPIREAVSGYLRQIALLVGIATLNAVAFYIAAGYFVTYLTETVGLDRMTAFLSNSAALMVYVLLAPLFGFIGDRFGRRPMLFAGCVGMILLSVPGFLLAGSGGLLAATLGQAMIVLPLVIVASAVTVTMVELFPTRVRYSGASLGYNVAYTIFGGTAPFVGAFLVASTGSLIAPAVYLAAIAIVVLPVIFKLPETYRLPTNRADASGPPIADGRGVLAEDAVRRGRERA
jgi:MHS family proline/betaine transporter-like MFS transporter